MKISVVTISFNQAVFLRECIDSVLNQNHSEVEYIVVDPGSTDGSREIIDSYGDRIIRVYEQDNGPADGLNRGFARATGQIYCYVNSDDALLPGALKKVDEFFESHQELDIICGHAYITDANSSVKRAVYSDKFNLRSAAYGASLAVQPATFFRAGIFRKVNGFNTDNRSNWDGELLIDMAIANAHIATVNDFFSCYRVHGNSITGTGSLENSHRSHGRKMFEKIMGRPFGEIDIWWQYFYRLKKHLANPRATLERIHKGPIFGSESK